MSKRLTDTEIWDKEWFMNLPPSKKCLVKYVFDKCDIAGFWKPNLKIASILIGDDYNIEDLLTIDEGRQFKKIDGKIFIPDFIRFQYGKLTMSSRVHKAVADLLIKHGVSYLVQDYLSDEEDLFIAKRKRITSKKRDEIFSQDCYTCQYCGNKPEKYELNIDHIVSVDNGGDNEDDNLITICASCNSRKINLDVFDFIEKYNKTPLHNLSKKLDTLSKKYDRGKEKDKEKEKDILDYEEIKFDKNSLTPKMVQVFKSCYPHYPVDEKSDFQSCLQIAYLIAKQKKWTRDSVLGENMGNVLDAWDKIVQFSTTDKWYSTRSISDFQREFQRIVQSMSAAMKPKTFQKQEEGKSTAPPLTRL